MYDVRALGGGAVPVARPKGPISSIHKSLLPVPDAHDREQHRRLCSPALVTERLGELVPLLKFVGFVVEQMETEKTVLSVPLLETPMNQNGRHQASVFYLIADYKLGVGMFAVLPGCYTVGVHDRCHALPVQFWLKSGRVQHLAPGTGTIRSEVVISPDQAAAMRADLIAKGRCELKETVRIYQGDQLVAVTEHEMGLYADLPRTAGTRASIFQVEKVKTSALMIAGLRADPLSEAVAQDQGIAIARRMTRASPQLPALVGARTRHLRELLRASGSTFSQVVVLGAGLDPKPVEFASPDQTWFLADLRDMLRERETRFAPFAAQSPHTVPVPLDLRLPEWPAKLIKAGFDPAKPALVILEGVSMYLAVDELRQSLSSIRALCGHPGSRLWLDHVTHRLLGMGRPEVRSFLASMARLGEPFVTGFDDPVDFAASESWRLVEHVSAAESAGDHDAIHREYRFSVLGPRDAPHA